MCFKMINDCTDEIDASNKVTANIRHAAHVSHFTVRSCVIVFSFKTTI